MSSDPWRIKREKKTIQHMIMLYCRKLHHTSDGICTDCKELLEYAMRRLDRCPFQENKTTCTNCKVHCYKPSLREKIRQVMRYSGPRMTYHHPVLALLHCYDGFRKEAIIQKKEKNRE
jgi:predicted amidophosphoribosyltransferase